MSHHPTSAELASFRRSIVRPLDIERARDEPNPFPLYPPIHRNGVDGAWAWERERGIDYRGRLPWLNTADHSHARREASAMRSRAYRVLSHSTAEPHLPVLDLLNPDGSYFGPWYEETSYGVPYTWNVCECCGNPHTYCDCYGIPA